MSIEEGQYVEQHNLKLKAVVLDCRFPAMAGSCDRRDGCTFRKAKLHADPPKPRIPGLLGFVICHRYCHIPETLRSVSWLRYNDDSHHIRCLILTCRQNIA